MRSVLMVLSSILVVLSIASSGCSSIYISRWEGRDMTEIPAGTYIKSTTPIDNGWGPSFTEFTTDQPMMLLTKDYFNYALETEAEEK